MLSERQTNAVSSHVQSIQVMALFFLVGAICLLVALAAIANWENIHTRIPMLVVIAAVSGISMYATSFLFYSFFVASTRFELGDDEGGSGAAGVIRTTTVLRMALIEGGCFLNGVVFLLDSGLVNLVVGAFGILLMIFVFPTRQRILDTAEKSLR